MLAHRPRRWPNIKPALIQRLLFAGVRPIARPAAAARSPSLTQLAIKNTWKDGARRELTFQVHVGIAVRIK